MLVPWIVVLAVRLPREYVAGNWDVAWVGFDVALLLGLAATAWAVWKRRQVAVPAAIVTGTLLVTDASFDVLTASTARDRAVSITFAVLVELPPGRAVRAGAADRRAVGGGGPRAHRAHAAAPAAVAADAVLPPARGVSDLRPTGSRSASRSRWLITVVTPSPRIETP